MPVLIGKVLLAIIILVVLNELTNADKTLIQPFKVLRLPERTQSGNPGPESSEIGQAISERIVHTLGLLQQELRHEVILASQPEAGDTVGRKQFDLVPVIKSTDISAALGKSPELDFGSVKIALDAFFAPLQAPICWLLGVRVINGSVQAEENGYSLLARANAGETWQITQEVNKVDFRLNQISPKIVDNLATKLSYRIITSDVTLASTITKSWAAFTPFRQGLQRWKEFEAKRDYSALSSAIGHFREATQEDPNFALAYYLLGLSLHKVGKPTAP